MLYGQMHKTRIDEQRNHIRKTRYKHLSLSKHCLEYCHNFDWNNIKVLDEKIIFKKHLI